MVGGATGAVELTNTDYQLPAPGPTFAGRDVFAPAAAHLCAGVPLDELGHASTRHELVPGIVPLPRDEDGTIVGEVLWVDRYGNCQLNVDPEAIETWGDAGAAALDPAPRGRAHRRPGRHLRRPPARPGRPGGRLLRPALRHRRPRLGRRRRSASRPATRSALVPLDATSDAGTPGDGHRPRPHLPRHPPAPKAVMRPGTTIVLAVLLALILGASAIQLCLRPLSARRSSSEPASCKTVARMNLATDRRGPRRRPPRARSAGDG